MSSRVARTPCREVSPLPQLGGAGIPSPAVLLQSRGCPASASASPPPPPAAPHLPRAAALPGAPETSLATRCQRCPRRRGRLGCGCLCPSAQAAPEPGPARPDTPRPPPPRGGAGPRRGRGAAGARAGPRGGRRPGRAGPES